jgi:hypothetical protein
MGKSLSAKMAKNSWPTAPVTPAMATFLPICQKLPH